MLMENNDVMTYEVTDNIAKVYFNGNIIAKFWISQRFDPQTFSLETAILLINSIYQLNLFDIIDKELGDYIADAEQELEFPYLQDEMDLRDVLDNFRLSNKYFEEVY